MDKNTSTFNFNGSLLKKIALFVFIVLIMRMILFWNPYVWKIYKRASSSEATRGAYNANVHVSTVTRVTLEYVYRDIYKYFGIKNTGFLKEDGKRITMVGSCLTRFLYFFDRRNYRPRANISLFAFPYFDPSEMVLFRGEIKRQKPGLILLYLSFVDIANLPRVDKLIAKAPYQGFYYFDIYDRMAQFKKEYPPIGRLMIHSVLSNLLPEYKYNFVFKNIIAHFAKAKKWRERRGIKKEKKSRDLFLENVRKDVFTHMHEKYIPVQMSFLEDFLEFFEEDTRIIIVDATHHPEHYKGEIIELDAEVKNGLEEMAGRYEHVTFLDRKALYWLDEKDFRDLYHMNRKGARKLRRSIYAHIEGVS